MPASKPDVVIVGASTRAAAFSALRAGLTPWCIDLFSDLDLQLRATVRAVSSLDNSHSIRKVVNEFPHGPWVYTGGMENRVRLVRDLAKERQLWGNDADVLRCARSADHLWLLFWSSEIPAPARWHREITNANIESMRWLEKPCFGAGGQGIRFREKPGETRRRHYYQEFIPGEAISAVYLGESQSARLLGVSWQLVGCDWLNAKPFQYCGTIGPLCPDQMLRDRLTRIGDILTRGCGIRGLFGVDFILRDGVPYPVEVNPRYSASIEVLEHAFDFSALGLHWSMFEQSAPFDTEQFLLSDADRTIGKAILFARLPLRFPDDGPWCEALRDPLPVERLPAFADIPAAGTAIPAGAPVLTFFATASDRQSCDRSLREIAQRLDRHLYES